MKVVATDLAGVLVIEPAVHADARGFFLESWNRRAFAAATGFDGEFVQDNHSRSYRHVLRGLHYQIRHAQGKLVRAVRGEIYDVAVDLRRGSATFGRWFGITLSEDNRRMLWIPPGFGHGFLVRSETAEVLYKTTDYWSAADERCIVWNDPALAIRWPLEGAPVLSEKDAAGASFARAEIFD